MKSLGIILACFLAFPLAGAVPQKGSAVAVLYETLQDEINTADAEKHASSFAIFLTKAEQKQASLSEQEFVRYLFTKIHKQFLKKYKASGSLEEVFEQGTYHCLTGTMLLATALEHFNIRHQVIETNYHIFILAETAQGEVLLEVTDAENGFADTKDAIESRIASYKAYTLEASGNKVYYRFKFDLFKEVSLTEMRGLMMYNRSLQAFNQNDFKSAIQYLEKSNTLYSSERIDEFSQLLLLSLQHSSLEQAERMEYIKSVFAIRQKFTPAVASLN